MNYRLIITLTFLILLISSVAFAETMTVITKTNVIRETPRFFGPVKAYVKYGDVIEALSRDGDWFRVRFRNITGFIHKTAVEKRTVSVSATNNQRTGVSEGEITLAGKGFNPQVERAYRNKYPQMRYDLVDRVERYNASEADLVSFIRAGGLTEPR
ncbi:MULTISPECIES: SH3 domain-containing protein [Thermodesulfovibrio]|jgi:hypothetical protein|uniref:SH3 domain-containing protein n=1 Tax=Thermodesulfovibrio TaxID=28261 RepID=UPI002618BFC6|nr:SH3 domain-containing protein [Thermodesulfovibrio sp.]